VGICFLRILKTAGKFPAELSSGKANNIRRKAFGQSGRSSPCP